MCVFATRLLSTLSARGRLGYEANMCLMCRDLLSLAQVPVRRVDTLHRVRGGLRYTATHECIPESVDKWLMGECGEAWVGVDANVSLRRR